MQDSKPNTYWRENLCILGIMLGYDTAKQCERYLGRTARTAVRIRHAA